MSNRRRPNPEDHRNIFAKPIARSVLRDKRLSWAARGLFAFLSDLPDGWRPRASHIVKMGPQGRDAINSLLKELRSVGALELLLPRSSNGKLNGKHWVVRDPADWAQEAKLGKSIADTTEDRGAQSSAGTNIGESAAKVHQSNGSPIQKDEQGNDQPFFNQGEKLDLTVVVDLDDLVEAAAWAAKKSDHSGYRFRIRERIGQHGPNPEDLATLQRWRSHMSMLQTAADNRERQAFRELQNQVDAERNARHAEKLFSEMPIPERLLLLDQIPHQILSSRRNEARNAIESGSKLMDLLPSLQASIRNILVCGHRVIFDHE